MNPEQAQQAALIGERIHAASHFTLVSHVRPDGDAVGSLLGLGLSLQAAGKTVEMVLADGVPYSFRHLEGADQIVRTASFTSGLTAVLDCSDLARTGGVLETRIPDLSLDHHATNQGFARHNLIWPQAAATCELLAACLPLWNLPMPPAVASALLSGLLSDTIGFRTPNVTPLTLRLAADLMEKGAPLSNLYHQALISRSLEAAHFWGAGLELGRLQQQGRVLWTVLTLSDRKRVGYPGNDDADLINLIASVEGADVALIFVEQKTGKIKVSWRAVPGIDISKVALQFGGGGHAAAAGAEISGSLEYVQQQVLEATHQYLSKLNGHSTQPVMNKGKGK